MSNQLQDQHDNDNKTYNLNVNSHHDAQNSMIQLDSQIQSQPSLLPMITKQPHCYPDNSITANTVTHQQSFPSYPILPISRSPTTPHPPTAPGPHQQAIPYRRGTPYYRDPSASAGSNNSAASRSSTYSILAQRHNSILSNNTNHNTSLRSVDQENNTNTNTQNQTQLLYRP